MVAESEKLGAGFDGRGKRRLWRYAPLLLWMCVIFFASTGEFSGANTSRIIRPLLLWLWPDISEERIRFVHFIVRKVAHFSEYAVFAFLAARAFASSSIAFLRRGFFVLTFLLIFLYSLSDEFHQSFVPSRVGTIYDSLIDTAGGLTALIVYAIWRKGDRSRRRDV
ncbi:MAG: VanZ family protein [Acidobacteria bacterium]|nr:VanZ family protein [Acidobacteriota bacterium]